MPIPPFDAILNVLPPHLGDPVIRGDLSPYRCTLHELCAGFATTAARKRILEGFLELRADLFSLGLQGFQWLGGSFVEDIETHEDRAPGDIDAITFVAQPATPAALGAVVVPRRDLWDPVQTKDRFSVDHYLVSLGSPASLIVEDTKYWYALFSHRRDGTWKGMLVVDLADQADDAVARIVLENTP
jgi:hypothetical protein